MPGPARVVTGRLTVIGLGPGPERWLTPAARAALDAATDIYGYTSYVSRLIPRADQRLHASDNREEIARAGAALSAAAEGLAVAIVSGGDPGVFAMGSAVMEAVEAGPSEWRSIDIEIEPGITAMLAAAARVGAPLGHDFCAISLSPNLKPWSLIERRLRLASEADFAIALYNPASLARPDGIYAAFDVLKRWKTSSVPVVVARAVGRTNEAVKVSSLHDADLSAVDMQTIVIVGTSETRVIPRPKGRPWVYTPRGSERA